MLVDSAEMRSETGWIFTILQRYLIEVGKAVGASLQR